jgi:hypothetical protein
MAVNENLEGSDRFVSLLGIRPIQYRQFGIYTIRMLNSGCIPRGDSIFEQVGKPSAVNTIYKTRRGFPNKNHYEIKPFFYNYADFMISRLAQAGDPMGFKRSLRFKVRLVDPTNRSKTIMQGSLGFADLGILSDDDLGIWEGILGDLKHEVKERVPVTSTADPIDNQVPRQVETIVSRMERGFGRDIHNAMVREIIEECAPPNNGRDEYMIGEDVFRSLTYLGATIQPITTNNYVEHDKGYTVGKKGKLHPMPQPVWRYTIYFDFVSSVEYTRHRELDTICTLMGGKPVTLYYVYPGNVKGAQHLYTTLPPYIAVDTRNTAKLLEYHWRTMVENEREGLPAGGAGAPNARRSASKTRNTKNGTRRKNNNGTRK